MHESSVFPFCMVMVDFTFHSRYYDEQYVYSGPLQLIHADQACMKLETHYHSH